MIEGIKKKTPIYKWAFIEKPMIYLRSISQDLVYLNLFLCFEISHLTMVISTVLFHRIQACVFLHMHANIGHSEDQTCQFVTH